MSVRHFKSSCQLWKGERHCQKLPGMRLLATFCRSVCVIVHGSRVPVTGHETMLRHVYSPASILESDVTRAHDTAGGHPLRTTSCVAA